MTGDIQNVDKRVTQSLKAYNAIAIVLIILLIVWFIFAFVINQEEWSGKIFILLVGVTILFTGWVSWGAEYTARESFMLQIAHSHSLAYTASGSSKDMHAHIFKYQGENGISHVLWGMYADNPITVFLYQYSTGGDPPRIFPFTVCQIQYTGKIPSVMITNLRHKKPPFSNRLYRKKLALGNEFDERFSILVPEDFQIEALQILTPEIAQTILTEGSKYSFEFIDHYLFLYVPGHMRNAKEFDAFIGFSKYLSETLGPRLARLHGDVSAMHEVYTKNS